MSEQSNLFTLHCQFCGALNEFTKKELYRSNDEGKEIFKEKFCLECGEPLTFTCPKCSISYDLQNSFKKHNFFKLDPAFDEPTPSILDEKIPLLNSLLKKYEEIIKLNNFLRFKKYQGDFIKDLPKIKEILKEIINEINNINNNQKYQKKFQDETKSLLKEIGKVEKFCNNILDNINDIGILNESIEKKIKNEKDIPFSKIPELFNNYLNVIKKQRDTEIEYERSTWAPGKERVPNFLLQDPNFYKTICPSCNTQSFVINHQIYIINSDTKKLEFQKSYGTSSTELDKDNESNELIRLRLNVSIFIQRGDDIILHATWPLLLEKGQPQYIGRNTLRELDYDEEEAEDLLYVEDIQIDPLAKISRTQLKIENKDGKIWITPQPFDTNRPGTYLENYEHDIRKEFPDGFEFTKGKIIIIPLTNEPNNPNRVELSL